MRHLLLALALGGCGPHTETAIEQADRALADMDRTLAQLKRYSDLASPPLPASLEATVTRIVDGDTIRVTGQTERVRLFGIDAPEAGKPGGAEATAALERLIPPGTGVRLEPVETDRYGRLVARVFVGGADLSRSMIDAGHAVEFCRYSRNAYGHC